MHLEVAMACDQPGDRILTALVIKSLMLLPHTLTLASIASAVASFVPLQLSEFISILEAVCRTRGLRLLKLPHATYSSTRNWHLRDFASHY